MHGHLWAARKEEPCKICKREGRKELAKEIIGIVQDRDQGLEKDMEKVHRIGRYNEGGKTPLKVKLRSQTMVEEILARTGKLAKIQNTRIFG